MFESDFEDNIFRRRLMKEVAPGLPTHFSFYSPMVKVQVQSSAEHLPGANGRYIGEAVTIEFVPEDAAAVERVREFVWQWEEHNEFTACRASWSGCAAWTSGPPPRPPRPPTPTS
jgi:hypothetical protein